MHSHLDTASHTLEATAKKQSGYHYNVEPYLDASKQYNVAGGDHGYGNNDFQNQQNHGAGYGYQQQQHAHQQQAIGHNSNGHLATSHQPYSNGHPTQQSYSHSTQVAAAPTTQSPYNGHLHTANGSGHGYNTGYSQPQQSHGYGGYGYY